MKILSLMMENVLKIRAIRIIPKSDVVEIKGDNAAGKSSVLDAIRFAFKGDRDLPPEPIKRGAKKAVIEVKIDGDKALGIPPFTIKRTITAKTSSTTITPISVASGDTPRAFLNKLIGKISFDPLAFNNQEGPAQRTALLELVGVDVDALDKKEKGIYDKRTAIGRDLKSAQARVGNLNVWPEVKEVKEVKVEDFSAKIQAAIENNNAIRGRIERNERRKEDVIETREEITKLKEDLAAHEQFILSTKAEYTAEKEALGEIELIDIDDLNNQLSTTSNTNSKIRDNIAHKKESASLTTIQNEYDKLDKALDTVREERVSLIQKANMPIPGLSFDDTGLLYNDLPLSQCSDGEKLMVSLGISMALNPTMRVLMIKDGSLLGAKNRAILAKMCEGKDFQCWTEIVMDKAGYERDGGSGILIEDGEMVMEDGEDYVSEVEPEIVPEIEPDEPEEKVNKIIVPDPADEDDDW